MSIKYINIFQSWATPKFTQIWIFGLKRNNLATLPLTAVVATDFFMATFRASGESANFFTPSQFARGHCIRS
jgi:hypothetical protein